MNPEPSINSHPSPTSVRETPSQSCDTLTLLIGPEAFTKYLQHMFTSGRRHVDILTHRLDPLLFANSDVCDALSRLVRAHRQAEVRILVKDPKSLIGKHHTLLALQKRLPSKIKIRQLKIQPQNENQGYVIVDQRQLLLQHHDGEFDGFCNTDAAPEAKAFLEEFTLLWQRQAAEINELRTLSL